MNSTNETHAVRTFFRYFFVALMAVGTVAGDVAWQVSLYAQSFSSGSDGSDGALNVPGGQGTIVFDPADIARWGRALDPDGDGVYNFTTITINSGSNLKFQADKVNRPVHLLASGDVQIGGLLDFSGATGLNGSQDPSLRRQVAVPGSGGFPGGAGGSGTFPATAGEGPGGGAGGALAACQGTTGNNCGRGGTFSGNRYLVPMAGGSGGGGAQWLTGGFFGGGAGGGAVLIASSTIITVTGTISAVGGNANVGGGGSGGAIRLVAPLLSGSGNLDVRGGPSQSTGVGGPGLVRLESFVGGTSLNLLAGGAFVTRGSPVDQSSLRPTSAVRITAVAGVAVPLNASGLFVVPDVTISNGGSVPVDIEATGIPPGTVVTLQVYPQSPTDINVVNLPTVEVTLTGTLQLSTATANFAFPYGFSRGVVRATWTQ